jgi:tetratricopeptide (TPR) repeat protein
VATALRHAMRLLETRPAMAEAQAHEILLVLPAQPEAQLILARARAAQGDLAGARHHLAALSAAQPRMAAAQCELGIVLARLGETEEAVEALSRAVKLEPRLAHAWRELGDLHALRGDTQAAEAAHARHIEASVNDPELLAAAGALCQNKLSVAEHTLRDFLKRHPTDVAALRMLAETGSRLGRYEDAEHLLARCLDLAPGFAAARQNYATVLYRQNKAAAAIAETDRLLQQDPKNPAVRALKAAALGQIGEYAQSVANYEVLLRDHPRQPKAWLSYGHALKALGRRDECVGAYRKSIALMPQLGEIWWSLANLKTYRFGADEIAAMTAQLARADLAAEDRWHFHFALGKALEDEADYERSFQHYSAGNTLRRTALTHSAEDITDHVQRSIAFFTTEFFRERADCGIEDAAPIFIVGLPRSGSTLIEQILASHSAVEGTMELPDITSMAKRLGGKLKRSDVSTYPEILRELDREAIAALGEEYLTRTRIHRRLGRAHFVDKMPNNFAHLGLIHLILPRARIIDARRHPLACCFSLFKQHFARGQGFSYDLDDIARYYLDYVALMAHFDAVLPGRVHRVFHENLVASPEREIRALLQHCDLPFEDACLRFHENARPVRTASSEQVRRPLSGESLEQWRHFETWLGPLKARLEPVLSTYPGSMQTFA